MKVKWNVMDGIIILVLLLAIAAGVVLLGGGSGSAGSAETKTVQLQAELTNQTLEFTELPKVGDMVNIGVKEKMQVQVTRVEVTPSRVIGKDLVEGKATMVEVSDRYDVLITMEGEGVETNADVKINGVAARVGAEAVLKSKNWAGVGYFLAVDPE